MKVYLALEGLTEVINIFYSDDLPPISTAFRANGKSLISIQG